MFKRKILGELEAHMLQKQATVITGMRRTGKTTLLKYLLGQTGSSNQIYIDLERLDNRELFSEKNYDNILTALKQRGITTDRKLFIGIDEVQLCENAASVIKYLYDNFDVKFIVSGSSSYYLKNLFSESLAGRKKIFELFPLDFGEFLTFKNISFAPVGDLTAFLGKRTNKERAPLAVEMGTSCLVDKTEYERTKALYEEFISYGGFPEVVLAENIQQKTDLLNDIISSYINIDIRNLSDFRNSFNIYNLIKLLAARAGSRIDVSKLAITAGISRITVTNYLELFEKTYLIRLVPAFTKNKDKEISKAKKLYFADTGLLNILANTGSGAQFENTLFNQLAECGDTRYYTMKNGREIDFIFNGDIAIEAKETPSKADLEYLKLVADGIGIDKTVLIGRNLPLSFERYLWGGMVR
jgi:hypothetical protein